MRRLVLPAAALLLAGCAMSGAPAPDPTPLIPLTHPHVLLSCPDLPVARLTDVPAEVDEVRRCRADFHDVDGVLNKVQYVERLAGDPKGLLDAYARPDDPPAEACDAVAHDPLLLWVVSGDEVSVVRAPRDGCGQPLAAAADAYAGADWETVLVAREVASTLER
jgi:hypothetical protein